MKILLIDIETSPNIAYVWGLFNQNIQHSNVIYPGSTICWTAKWLGESSPIYYSEFEHGHDVMVLAIHELLEEADVVVHYNGKRFDIPTLNKEFVLLGLDPPSPYKEIDLYQVVKRKFKFSSNKLDFICEQLGLGNKTQHKGMSLWRDCMAGDAEAWRVMKEYNINDVFLLEELYAVVQPWIPNHPNHGLYVASEVPVCPNCGSTHVIKKGFAYNKTTKYQRYKCKDCGASSRERTQIEKPNPALIVPL